MSKAFLRESDDDAGLEPLHAPVSTRRAGEKNYLTPDGVLRLQGELAHLRSDSRPPLVARITETDAKRELQRVDQRIRRLELSLQTAEVVAPPAGEPDAVAFGAMVTVRETDGVSARYRIVGLDEIDSERGWISYQSPLARALLRAKIGQRITYETPRGPSDLEVLAVSYDPEAGDN